jgi:type III pantothenate kinase
MTGGFMTKDNGMLLMLDIGNTHTHIGVARGQRVSRQLNLPTSDWSTPRGARQLRRWLGAGAFDAAVLCSVVPQTTPLVKAVLARTCDCHPLELTAANVLGVGVNYPRPETIGPDRLANAIAARALHGAPVLIVDFGTAVTLDVVDRAGDYVGGVIAPGLAAMTDYLHERTALLPSIRIRDVPRAIGRSTEEAMRIGAVHGYRGLIHTLIREIRTELGSRRLPVVATGGYARLMARGLPEIARVDPGLTLEGLRRFWHATNAFAEPG